MVTQMNLDVHRSSQSISVAQTSLTTKVLGHCYVDIELDHQSYSSVRLGVLRDLCSDIILGQDFQKKHKNVILEFGGSMSDLKVHNPSPVCALSAASIEEPSLFANLLPDASQLQVNQDSSVKKTESSSSRRLIVYLLRASSNQVSSHGELSVTRNVSASIIHKQ